MKRRLKYIVPATTAAAAVVVIAWAATSGHPSGAPLGYGKVR
ncbi:hypothetical protein EU244_030790 [Rhodococcus qingshengii]|nr:hypothetical protein [Rhodococcus qingshengii]